MNNGKLVPICLHVATDDGRVDLFNVWVNESIYDWLSKDLSHCESLKITSITCYFDKNKEK